MRKETRRASVSADPAVESRTRFFAPRELPTRWQTGGLTFAARPQVPNHTVTLDSDRFNRHLGEPGGFTQITVLSN
jgi:hypothetical protein